MRFSILHRANTHNSVPKRNHCGDLIFGIQTVLIFGNRLVGTLFALAEAGFYDLDSATDRRPRSTILQILQPTHTKSTTVGSSVMLAIDLELLSFAAVRKSAPLTVKCLLSHCDAIAMRHPVKRGDQEPRGELH